MRPSRIFLAAGILFAVQSLPLPAMAQQQPAAAPPPPKMEKLEEGNEPAVTIRSNPDQTKITEKRAPGGKRTEVKVTKGNNTYYLKPNEAAGSAQPGDAQADQSRPAQWRVMTFDGNRKQKEQQAASTTEASTPPAAEKASQTAKPAAKPAENPAQK